MKKLNIIFSLLFFISCTNGNNAENNIDTIKDDTSAISPEETETSCYENIDGKDTVTLSIFHNASVITGSLKYNYYEKDKNSGTISGNMFGDTLIADYIFMSEGKASIREVAFLKQENNLIEGYADMIDANGKMIFTNRNALSFTGKPLIKTDCNEH